MSKGDAPVLSRSATKAAGKPNKQRKRKFTFGKALLLLLGIVVVAVGVYAYYLLDVGKQNLNKISEQDPIRQIVPEDERAQVKPIAIALLGLDTRGKLGTMNTDVMMVAALNPVSKTATIVTIPRDSLLNVSGYAKSKANAHYAGFYNSAKSKNKLDNDQAHVVARDKTRELLGDFFGIPIQYTAVINFDGYIDVIDALGGIDIYVDQDMRWVDSIDGTDINLKKGQQELSGKEALDFVRYRQSNRGTAGSSDFARNTRQTEVIGAIVDKMMSFSTITKVDSLLNAVGDHLRTNIPAVQIQDIMKTYFGIKRADIRFITLEGSWKSPYVYLKEDKLKTAKQALAEELQPKGRTAGSVTTDGGAKK